MYARLANANTEAEYSACCQEAAGGLSALAQDYLGISARAVIDIQDATRELSRLRGILFSISQARKGASVQRQTVRELRTDVFTCLDILRSLLDPIFDIFTATEFESLPVVWQELEGRIRRKYGQSLVTCLACVAAFLEACHDVVVGNQPLIPGVTQNAFRTLVRTRRPSASERTRRHSYIAENTAPPRPSPLPNRASVSYGTTVYSSYPSAADLYPPLSPTYTSSSSNTLPSSHTSYSNGSYTLEEQFPPPQRHWGEGIMGRKDRHPMSPYAINADASEPSACGGQPESNVATRLQRSGYQFVCDARFDGEQFGAEVYWEAEHSSALIVLWQNHPNGFKLHWTQLLRTLRISRDRSCLELYRVTTANPPEYKLWARLNFGLHEPMVLFSSILIAMKYQDGAGIPHPLLHDKHALKAPSGAIWGEELLFERQIVVGERRQMLRIWRDLGSGVVRLEACPSVGSRTPMPVWTAFITKYAANKDVDWAAITPNNKKVVSLIAIKPAPYTFHQVQLPIGHMGEYLLTFTNPADSRDFVLTWRNICN